MDENFKQISMDRRIHSLLKEYSLSSSEYLSDVLYQAIFDYIVILNHVKGPNPDRDLKMILNSFENNANIIIRKIKEVRVNYLERRMEEALLLGRKIPVCDNGNYFMCEIPVDLYNGIKKIMIMYPNLYDKKKTVKIKEIVDRSVLFRVLDNEELVNNPVYREFRVEYLLSREKSHKLNWSKVIEKISVKEKVRWSGGS